MPLTYEDILTANNDLSSVPIKGKDYVQVNERVKAFRKICPSGTIQTSITAMENNIVTMKAEVFDADGRLLATGWAQENRDSTFINKTSYIENCETSAVGRALGFAGIGIDASMCSAYELVNAVVNQDKPDKKTAKKANQPDTITEKEQEVLKNMCENKGLDVKTVFPNGLNLTSAQYTEAVRKLESYRP